MQSLKQLFLDELADMYDSEHRLILALPRMVHTATHPELQTSLQNHLGDTEQQLGRLEQVFQSFGEIAQGKRCEAIVGLTKEADEIAAKNKGFPTINAALISAAQKIEHYEIASYGCLVEWASQLGNDEATALLQQILDEEKAADETLTELARQSCKESAQDAAPDTGARRISRSRSRPARSRAKAS